MIKPISPSDLGGQFNSKTDRYFRLKWVKRNRKNIGRESRAVRVAQEMVSNLPTLTPCKSHELHDVTIVKTMN